MLAKRAVSALHPVARRERRRLVYHVAAETVRRSRAVLVGAAYQALGRLVGFCGFFMDTHDSVHSADLSMQHLLRADTALCTRS